jgi:hypothetical protein
MCNLCSPTVPYFTTPTPITNSYITLAPLPKAQLAAKPWPGSNIKEDTNPMRYGEKNTVATALVTAPPTLEQDQKTYLTRRLDNLFYDAIDNKLRKQFNIGVTGSPSTYAELIDMIKNDKFKLDEDKIKKVEKARASGDIWCYGNTDGIIWDLPKPDRNGYHAATVEYEVKKRVAMDVIMVNSAADGLAAIKALESWEPTGAAN